ncbi:MAG: GNAT family N-acetyltransferase [Anaerolineae bacterium]|nr:GNAT family N-acetyltransferase [Anaerolineae bacterium]
MDGIQIKTARMGDLDDAGRKAVVDVCADAFKMPEFYDLFSFLKPDNLHVMAYRDAVLIGHTVVSTRWMQPEGLSILCSAYIDAVAVASAEQGKGIGKGLMQHVASVITDYEIAGLETGVPGFYESVGWELWRGSLAGRGDDGLIPTPEQTGVMILRLPKTPALNLDGLLTIEDQKARIW